MEISYSSRDTSLLAINLLTYRIFTQLPMSFIKSAKFTAPLSTLLGGAISAFVIFLIALSIFKCSKGNIIDIAESTFGTAGKIIVSAVFAVYLAISQVFALSDFSKLTGLIAFPASPLWFVSGFLILGGILGALGNTRAVVRLHGVFVPVILVVFLSLVVSTILPSGNTDTLANPPQKLSVSMHAAFSQAMLYADALLIFLIAPTKESRQAVAKRIGLGAAISLALNTLFILAFTLKIPSSIAQNGQFPAYLLMKEVYFGRFFQRLDAMILLISALSSMLYLSLSLNLLTSVLHQGFHLPQNRIVTSILGISVFCLVLSEKIFPNDLLSSLIYVLSLGVLGILILTALFVKVRRSLREKN